MARTTKARNNHLSQVNIDITIVFVAGINVITSKLLSLRLLLFSFFVEPIQE